MPISSPASWSQKRLIAVVAFSGLFSIVYLIPRECKFGECKQLGLEEKKSSISPSWNILMLQVKASVINFSWPILCTSLLSPQLLGNREVRNTEIQGNRFSRALEEVVEKNAIHMEIQTEFSSGTPPGLKFNPLAFEPKANSSMPTTLKLIRDPNVPDWAKEHYSEDIVPDSPHNAFENCDLIDGHWVYDARYPLWNPRLKMNRNDFNCVRHGRKDTEFLKLRWQPNSCNMPRFNASFILERMRNRRIAFIGDSMAKNQFFSLAGMLTNGTKPDLILFGGRELFPDFRRVLFAFHFIEFNVSLEHYSRGFLVDEVKLNGKSKDFSEEVGSFLEMDEPIKGLDQIFSGVDLAVFNAGHWFRSVQLHGRKCFPRINGTIDFGMDPNDVFSAAMKHWSRWLDSNWKDNKTVFFRSYSPIHRDTIRVCPSKLPIWSEEKPIIDPKVGISVEVLKSMKKPPLFLDIAELSGLRNDAHLSFTRKVGTDCSHWCTPGVPDTWNEIMFSMMMQRRRQPFL